MSNQHNNRGEIDREAVDLVRAGLARVMRPDADDVPDQLATLAELGRIAAATFSVAWNAVASEPADGETSEEREALTTAGPRLASLMLAGLCSRPALEAVADSIERESWQPVRDWLDANPGAKTALEAAGRRLQLLVRTEDGRTAGDRCGGLAVTGGLFAAQAFAWAASALNMERLTDQLNGGQHPVEAISNPETAIPWARGTTVEVNADGTERRMSRQEIEVERLLRELGLTIDDDADGGEADDDTKGGGDE